MRNDSLMNFRHVHKYFIKFTANGSVLREYLGMFQSTGSVVQVKKNSFRSTGLEEQL